MKTGSLRNRDFDSPEKLPAPWKDVHQTQPIGHPFVAANEAPQPEMVLTTDVPSSRQAGRQGPLGAASGNSRVAFPIPAWSVKPKEE